MDGWILVAGILLSLSEPTFIRDIGQLFLVLSLSGFGIRVLVSWKELGSVSLHAYFGRILTRVDFNSL